MIVDLGLEDDGEEPSEVEDPCVFQSLDMHGGMISKIIGEVNQIYHDGKNFTMDLWVVPPEDLAGVVKEVNEKGFLGHLP